MLTAVTLCSTSIFLTNKVNQMDEATDPLIQQDFELFRRLESSTLGVVRVQQWLTDIGATRGRDGLDDGCDQARIFADLVRNDIGEMAALNPENQALYESPRSRFEDYYEAGQAMAKAYIAEGPTGGNRLMGNFDEVFGVLQRELEPVKDEITLRLDATLATESSAVKNIS